MIQQWLVQAIDGVSAPATLPASLITALALTKNRSSHTLCSSCADLLGLDSGSKSKLRRKSRPLSGMSTASSRPAQASATEVAKAAMKAQEPQLLDKMENVAYRLAAQADGRKKHMNSR